jgi:ABC-type sugar transport system ATPase subunit
MASITLQNIVKEYGTGAKAVPVIHNLNAQINDGEFVVIVGPSGCGKSTLLRMVAGLEEVTGGHISIGDRIVNDLEPAERDIAMVFQNYALYPHMSVFENMAYGLKIAKVPENCQAGSASVWRWAEPSCDSRRYFCLTSPCPIWTPSCAPKPAWKFKSCTANWASLLCSSHTIK